MNISGHHTTLAMFIMMGAAIFIGFGLKNFGERLDESYIGVLLIYTFITMANLSSFLVVPGIWYMEKSLHYFLFDVLISADSLKRRL